MTEYLCNLYITLSDLEIDCDHETEESEVGHALESLIESIATLLNAKVDYSVEILKELKE